MKALLSFMMTVIFCWSAGAQETSFAAPSSQFSMSPWGSSYFSFTSADVGSSDYGFPAINVYNYLSAHYKFDRDQRLAIRPAWSMNTAGFDENGNQKTSEVMLGDLHFNYSNYALGLLPGDWQLSGALKLYLPTSESSQTKKVITYLKAEVYSEKLLSRGWLLQYTAKPGYWFHSQKAYRSESSRINFRTGAEETVVDARVNKWGELNHYFGVGNRLNSVFTPKLEMGFIHEWSYNSDQVSRSTASSNKFKISPNTEIHVSRSLWFVLGIENTFEINDSRLSAEGWRSANGQNLKMFEPRDSQYFLLTFLSI